jgi:hypothetical protein
VATFENDPNAKPWPEDDPRRGAPNQTDIARMKKEARDNPANQNPARSTASTSPKPGSRTVTGLMVFAIGFALIGNEININEKNKGAPSVAPITEGAKIIIGGIIATSFLTLISHAGDTGRELAVGLALVTAATSLLVFGGTPSNPGGVWRAIEKVVSSTPTTPTGSTAATKPTTGTATTAALVQAA